MKSCLQMASSLFQEHLTGVNLKRVGKLLKNVAEVGRESWEIKLPGPGSPHL